MNSLKQAAWIGLAVVTLLTSASAYSMGGAPTVHERGLQQWVVTVHADNPVMQAATVGFPLEQYRMYRYEGGHFEPVPMQIDELDRRGQVYVAETEQEYGGALVGERRIFDGHDLLLFMYTDASETRWQNADAEEACEACEGYEGIDRRVDKRVTRGARERFPIALEGIEWLQELVIKAPGQADRFVYLTAVKEGVDSAPPAGYLQVDEEERLFASDVYTLQFSKKNPLESQDFFYYVDGRHADAVGRKEAQADVQPIFDGLKVRVTGGVFAKFAKMTLNNRNVHVKVSEIHQGPVRARMQMEARFTMMKLPLLKIHLQSHFYRSAIMFDAWFKLPKKQIRALFKNPVTDITVDGNNLLGATVEVVGFEGIVGYVDGRMTARELSYLGAPLDPYENWVRLTVGQFQMVSSFMPPKKYPVKLGLVYEDDAVRKDKPERFLGQLPNLGYRVSDVSHYDQLDMGIKIVFDSAVKEESLAAYTDRLEAEPTVVQGRFLRSEQKTD